MGQQDAAKQQLESGVLTAVEEEEVRVRVRVRIRVGVRARVGVRVSARV